MSDQSPLEERFSGLVYGAIQDSSNNTDRSKQQQSFRLGVSNIGHCRQYAKYITEQHPFTDVRDKTAAFYGTVLGDAIETQLAKDHPDWLYQHSTVFEIPSGGQIAGHPDVVIPASAATEEHPQGVLDLKSKAELDTVRRIGRTQQQDFQLTMYAKACIDEGLLDPTEPIYLTNVYFDRAAKGGGMMPYSITTEYDERTLETIDEWIGDVKYAVVHDQDASRDLPREFCAAYCFAGETEVLTRDGIARIGDLAGQDVELLVPSRQGEGLTHHGRWETVPVREYGVQPLMRVTIGRGRSRKVVYATPEHRWFVREDGSHTREQRLVETQHLEPGDILRGIRHAGASGLVEIPFATAQGFVFGDGTRGRVSFYANSPKWDSMAGYFAGHPVSVDGDTHTVSRLPKSWKDLPSIREDGSFLLSWLAGYFAADGTVTKGRQVSLSSSVRGNLEFVRSICGIAGVGTGQIVTYERSGFGGPVSSIYSMTLVAGDLPDWFFRNRAHAMRMDGYESTIRHQWKVVSVEETDRLEPVYCAEVPDVEAFALADGILTHNCEYWTACRSGDTDAEGLLTDPNVLAAVDMYREGGALEREGRRLKDSAKVTLKGVSGSTGEFVVRPVEVGPAEMKAYTRAGFVKLDIRPVPRTKG